jgi:hypothetical protein
MITTKNAIMFVFRIIISALCLVGILYLLGVTLAADAKWFPILIPHSILTSSEEVKSLSSQLQKIEEGFGHINQNIKEAQKDLASMKDKVDASTIRNNDALQEIKRQTEALRIEAEAQRKAADQIIKEINEEAKKIREAADESIKSLSLYRSFIQEHQAALTAYLQEIQAANADLNEVSSLKSEVIKLELSAFAVGRDSLTGRWGNKQVLQKMYTQTMENVLSIHLKDHFIAYEERIRLAQSNLLSGLYLGSRQTQFPSPARAWATPLLSTSPGLSELLFYLTDEKIYARLIIDESLTWIPVGGDAYEFFKMVYNHRYNNIIKPLVENIVDGALSNIRIRSQQVSKQADSLAKSLSDPKVIHTPRSLYAEYSLRN